MSTTGVIPVLNVSSLRDSFAWFEKLGWEKAWDWGDPPDFGSVCSGESQIFLCENGQGGRGAAGVWLCIGVEDVDAVHRRCVEQRLDVAQAPEDMPWNLREMLVRHPDGHVLRIGQHLPETDE
ncbi:MAG: bleomycin resistance family protein [Gemmatimonadota bacterium]|nr:bleomycin resistance family protein [Gemmatimonadota bacterium]